MKIHPKSPHSCYSFVFSFIVVSTRIYMILLSGDNAIPLVVLNCYVPGDVILTPLHTGSGCCATHITCGDKEQRILDSQTSPYTISPFWSFINERQQAGTLLFSLHLTIPPAWNSLIVFSLNLTAQFSPFPYIYMYVPALSFIFNSLL